MRTTTQRLARQLKALVGERHPETSPAALRKTAHYLETCFAKLGWKTGGHPFSAFGGTYRNVVAIKNPRGVETGKPSPPLIIGAHYDTVSGSPGADDNASGLVVLLEIAARLRHVSLRRPVWLVAFGLEEYDRLGSQAFASTLKADGQALLGAIVLECVGFATGRPDSQQAPSGVPIAISTTGDFLAIVGNDASRSLVEACEQGVQGHGPRLNTSSLVVPGRGEALPHTRRSDHASFWDAGFPAVMLTDTANFRNPHYHQTTDKLETLNLKFLEAVVAGVTRVVLQLTSER